MSVKIAIICADLNPNDLGGAEVHIVEIVRELSKKDYEFHVFVGNDDSAKSLFGENVFVHAVKYSKIKNLNSFFFSRAVYKSVLNCGIKFDIIHAKQVYPQAIVAAKLKKKLGIPLYVTVQNPFAYKEEMILKGIFGRIFSLGLWVLEMQIRNALKCADVCACVSSYSLEGAKKMGAGNCVLVPNGIDLEKFKLYEGERNKFEITTTSTLIPRNGIDILIEAMPAVLEKFPMAKLKIAGEGSMEHSLKARIAGLKIDNSVTFLGTLRHEAIPELVKKSHVFVRPSRFEGFGVSFVEAMALGTPVITCPVGGIVDFLTDGATGYLVPVENPAKLSDAIIRVFENEEGVKIITKKARKLVEERYDWRNIAQKAEDAYLRATSRK